MCDYLRSAPLRRVPHPLEESPLWGVLGSILACLVACVISLPLLLASVLVLPICATVRWILFKFYLYRRQSNIVLGRERLRAHESRWMGEDWNNSVFHSILIFESHERLLVDHFQRLFSTRILPVYPRLSSLPIAMPSSAGGGFCWQMDSQFSIAHHIIKGPEKLENLSEINSYVSALLRTGLPKDKPPWEVQVITPCGRQTDTVVVVRVHQSIADGTSLLRMLCHSLADSNDLEIFERPQFGCLAFGLNMFRACLTGPFTLLVWLCLSTSDCNPLTRHCTWSGSFTVSWSASIALPKVIRIKQVTRSTVNCVVLSALAGALRMLLKGCGVRRPPNVKVLVPLDIRSHPGSKTNNNELGNKSASVTLSLPVSLEGCIPRLWATRRILRTLRTSSDPVLVYIATTFLMTVAPASVAGYLLDLIANKTSLQYSSFPGPTSHVSVGGEKLKHMFCLLPAPSNVGISITAITYADQVHLSVAAERALGPAAQLLLDYLENQVDVLCTLLLHRRVPGECKSSYIPVTPSEIVNSPIPELERKLSFVQKEVIRLSTDLTIQEDGNLQLALMRGEFTQLVGELKRRQSCSENQKEEEVLSKARRRAQSCSMSSSLKNMLTFKPTTHFVYVKEKHHLSNKNEDSITREGKIGQHNSVDNLKRRDKGTCKMPELILKLNEKESQNFTHFPCASSSLSEQKHRKNSFEIIRDRNKRKDFRPNPALPKLPEKCSELPDLEKLNDCDIGKRKDSGSELDTETDYSDTTIKISDEETMDLDYDDLKNSGPINKNLRDLYCSNYLDHKLSLLKGEERRLSQQMHEINYEFYRAIDDNDVEGGLLI